MQKIEQKLDNLNSQSENNNSDAFLRQWSDDQKRKNKCEKIKQLLTYFFVLLVVSYAIISVFKFLSCRGALFSDFECNQSTVFWGYAIVTLIWTFFGFIIMKIYETKWGKLFGALFIIIGILTTILSVRSYYEELNFEKNYKFHPFILFEQRLKDPNISPEERQNLLDLMGKFK